MPATSGKQYRFMQGIAHGGIPATGGLTKGKALEFVKATPKTNRIKWSTKKKKKLLL
jgi:hypothetical protein